MLKPIKLFLMLLSILLAISVISLLFPRDGFKIGPITITIPSPLSIFNINHSGSSEDFTLNPELALLEQYLDSITAQSINLDTSFIWTDTDIFALSDTASSDSLSISHSGSPMSITADILKNRLVPIEFPDSSFSALETFFNSLASGKASQQQVRVMHFGDSQIEGDRITSFLRLRLQGRFGGTGIGLVHAVPHSYQPGGIFQTSSSNWKQVLLTDLGRGAVDNRFGIMGGYSVYTSSRRLSKGGFNEAWISIERRGSSGSSPRNFTQCRIMYGHGSEPFMVSLTYNGKTQEAEMVAPNAKIEQQVWSTPLSERSFQIDFKGDESPMVFGVSLESPKGIVVDNIAIRGSSGIDFTRADDKSLRQAFSLVKPSLVILQFGVNVVPHIVESYTYYENQMYQQILAIKRARPNVAVLLIGVSDMARREGGQFISYPNIEKIRDAQRNAAHRAGAAFWDCYSAMGGQNSMPAWTFATPPLASKDFIHFTLRGSNLIAEMFYSSLMESFNKYISTKENNQ